MASTKKQNKTPTQNDEVKIENVNIQVQDGTQGGEEVYYIIKDCKMFEKIKTQQNTIKVADLYEKYNDALIENLFIKKGFLKK